MISKRLLLVATAAVLTMALACTNKQKEKYIGTWHLCDISVDGQLWDDSTLPDDEMTLAVNGDGSVVLNIGEYNEKDFWHVDDQGRLVMAEQTAIIDENGYLIAEHNGTLIRLARR